MLQLNCLIEEKSIEQRLRLWQIRLLIGYRDSWSASRMPGILKRPGRWSFGYCFLETICFQSKFFLRNSVDFSPSKLFPLPYWRASKIFESKLEVPINTNHDYWGLRFRFITSNSDVQKLFSLTSNWDSQIGNSAVWLSDNPSSESQR